MKTFILAVLAYACLFSGAQATKCLVYGDIAHANGGDSAFWNAFPSIQSQFNLMSCRRALGQPQDHVPAIQYCEYQTWFGIFSFFMGVLILHSFPQTTCGPAFTSSAPTRMRPENWLMSSAPLDSQPQSTSMTTSARKTKYCWKEGNGKLRKTLFYWTNEIHSKMAGKKLEHGFAFY